MLRCLAVAPLTPRLPTLRAGLRCRLPPVIPPPAGCWLVSCLCTHTPLPDYTPTFVYTFVCHSTTHTFEFPVTHSCSVPRLFPICPLYPFPHLLVSHLPGCWKLLPFCLVPEHLQYICLLYIHTFVTRSCYFVTHCYTLRILRITVRAAVATRTLRLPLLNTTLYLPDYADYACRSARFCSAVPSCRSLPLALLVWFPFADYGCRCLPLRSARYRYAACLRRLHTVLHARLACRCELPVVTF